MAIKKNRLSIALLFIVIISSISAPRVTASTVFSYPVIDLNTAETLQLVSEDQLSVVIFFEPNCSWCFKQTKIFNQYIKQCNTSANFIGLGVNAKRTALKKAAWKMKADFPVYMASDELLSATGKIASTPLTLILDAKGRVVSHVKGYVNFEKWHQIIQKNTPKDIECSEQSS